MRPTLRRVSLIVVMMSLAAALPLSVNASANVQHAELSGEAWNSCTNELMWVETRYTGVVQSIDEAGRTHFTYHASQTGSAVA